MTAFKQETYADAAGIKEAYEAAVAAINGTAPDSLSYLRAALLARMSEYYNAQSESYFTAEGWAASFSPSTHPTYFRAS